MSATRAALATLILCGLLYPLALTAIGQLIFPFQANGSLLRAPGGTVLGSRLIGQQWNGPQWFHGRPSATTTTDHSDPSKTVPLPYNAANSGGSNLGPTSNSLMQRLMADRESLESAQSGLVGKNLPADMITTSASGLDPDISPENASLQVARVAHARNADPARLQALVQRYTTARSFEVFGEPRVNVLELNLALQRACPSNEDHSASGECEFRAEKN
ncbi:MAG TPA: potassium-transporting ATPase subunit KdpC [Burkholderiaceae bacterium]|nr:potassium-transporting ATPase subunit KdpC [Burkholderiaceae bacterium]